MTKAQEKQQTIDEILTSLNPDQKSTIQNLRNLIKTVVPQTVELVKQGKIVYKLGSKDFVWISRYSTHIDLGFAMGASLASEHLKTRGVAEHNDNVRHIEVTEFAPLKPELTRLLRDASALGFEHCEAK
jgi:hypothetical protein